MSEESYVGINIERPMSELIATREKTIEARPYPLPEDYLNEKIALIDTPGPEDKFKERVIAIVKFTECFQYKSKREFYEDSRLHHIERDSEYAWERGEMWGWKVEVVQELGTPRTLNFRTDENNEVLYEGTTSLNDIAGRLHMDVQEVEDFIKSFLESGGKKQIMIDGLPGTGKSIVAQTLADYLTQMGEGDPGVYKVISCDRAMTFEHVFQGLAPGSDGTLNVQKGIFTEVIEEAIDYPDAYHVVVLDEINRCNLPQVFGQLLFLLEHRDKDHSVDLPYEGESIYLPENLFIIATLNSADRASGVLDFAFRRRFAHFLLEPSAEILQRFLDKNFSNDSRVEIDLIMSLFKLLNEKLAVHDSNFQVGHSYFMTSFPLSMDELKRLWVTEIAPLLREKFFHMRDIVESEFGLEVMLEEINDNQESEIEEVEDELEEEEEEEEQEEQEEQEVRPIKKKVKQKVATTTPKKTKKAS